MMRSKSRTEPPDAAIWTPPTVETVRGAFNPGLAGEAACFVEVTSWPLFQSRDSSRTGPSRPESGLPRYREGIVW